MAVSFSLPALTESVLGFGEQSALGLSATPGPTLGVHLISLKSPLTRGLCLRLCFTQVEGASLTGNTQSAHLGPDLTPGSMPATPPELRG